MLKRKLLVIIIVLMPVLSQALPPEIEADRLLLQAKEAIEEKEFNRAVTAFEKIQALNIKKPTVFWFHYGKTLVETKKSEQGLKALETYLTQAGNSGKFYQEALQLYSQAEKNIEAEKKHVSPQSKKHVKRNARLMLSQHSKKP